MEGVSARDLEVLRREHRFLPDDDEEGEGEKRRRLDGVTAAYEQSLVRDFVLADLSRASEGLVGLRWRSGDEVRAGKGDRSCAAKGCPATEQLCAVELLFAYQEHGQDKKSLVTCVLCPLHADDMRRAKTDPYQEKKRKKEEKKQKKKQCKEEKKLKKKLQKKNAADNDDLW